MAAALWLNPLWSIFLLPETPRWAPPPPLHNLYSTFIKPRPWMITTVQARERWVHIKMNMKLIERTSFHPIYYCSHFDRVYFHINCNIFTRDKPLIRTTAAWARLKLCHSLMSLSCGSLVKENVIFSCAILEIHSHKDESLFSSRLWRCSHPLWSLPELQMVPFISENVSQRRRGRHFSEINHVGSFRLGRVLNTRQKQAPSTPSEGSDLLHRTLRRISCRLRPCLH